VTDIGFAEGDGKSWIDQARDDGYTDKEINAYLAPRWEKARVAGYSDDEIRQHLGIKNPTPQAAANESVRQQASQPYPTQDWSKWRSADGILAEQSGASSIQAYNYVPPREAVIKFLDTTAGQSTVAGSLAALTPGTQPAAITLYTIAAGAAAASHLLKPSPAKIYLDSAVDVVTEHVPALRPLLKVAISTILKEAIDIYLEEYSKQPHSQ